MATKKRAGYANLTTAAALGAALLSGCAHTNSFSENCKASCFATASENELIPIRAGSTPVFAVAGSIIEKRIPKEGDSSPTESATDWSSTDVQTLIDGFAEGLHRTAGVETLAQPAAALAVARLAGDPRVAQGSPSQDQPAGEPELPEGLSAPMLAVPIWGERATHLLLFQAVIYTEPLKFNVGGAPPVPAIFIFVSRRTALTLSASVLDRATGHAVSHLSMGESTEPTTVWIFYVPVPDMEAASPSQALHAMSHRIGEEFGRRFPITASGPATPPGEPPNAPSVH